jgi:hypothetical protein
MVFFFFGLSEAFDCLRICKECAKVSSVAEKAVYLADTEGVTIQYCIGGTLQSQLRQTLMHKKGFFIVVRTGI